MAAAMPPLGREESAGSLTSISSSGQSNRLESNSSRRSSASHLSEHVSAGAVESGSLERQAYERYVLVRPPNGVDIQIQLLVQPHPQHGQRQDGVSESTIQHAGNSECNTTPETLTVEALGDLKRTASNRSTRSASSSRTSIASGFTSSSMRKRTAPLFNLEFHKLSSTVVTDAGTDEKIAKFTKKGIDLLNFAQIEPIEATYGATPRPSVSNKRASMISDTSNTRSVSPDPTIAANAPIESRLETIPQAKQMKRIESDETRSMTPTESQLLTPTPASTPTPTATAKDKTPSSSLLNKFKRMSLRSTNMASFNLNNALNIDAFKFKGASPSAQSSKVTSPAAPSDKRDSVTSPASSTGPSSAALSLLEGPKQALSLFKTRETSVPTTIGPSTAMEEGISTASQPRSLPNAYTWQIRKWLRKDLEQKELVFRDIGVQWRRQRRSAAGDRRTSALKSSGMVRVPSDGGIDPLRKPNDLLHPLQGKRSDPSMSSRVSIGVESGEGATEHAITEEEDYDSDPEDSERPWLCDLILPTLPLSASARTLRRVRLGTLKPAPHHPRLIGQLNVPLALKPLSLGLLVTVTDGQGKEQETTAYISVEEMKDLLCVTALWLVVSQSLGGVANRKKGDSVFRF